MNRISCITMLALLMGMTGSAWAAREHNKPVDAHKLRALAVQRVTAHKDVSFERVHTETDLLRGFTTFSTPDSAQPGTYRAAVFVRWGDLDNKLKTIGKEYYNNWDGSVSVEGGTAKVAKEFAFDDGAKRRRHKHKHASGGSGPAPGSGRDELIHENDPARVEWKSGVVGATDGLLIDLSLKSSTASGEIKAGQFTIPYTIRPKPTATAPAANRP